MTQIDAYGLWRRPDGTLTILYYVDGWNTEDSAAAEEAKLTLVLGDITHEEAIVWQKLGQVDLGSSVLREHHDR